MLTAERHQLAIARKSLKMNRVGRMVAGIPLAEAYRIVFKRDLSQRLHQLISEYPDIVQPHWISWELGTYQNADTTEGLRGLLEEIEHEDAA